MTDDGSQGATLIPIDRTETSLMKAISMIAILLTLSAFTACTTIQSRSMGVAELKDISLDRAISISTQAALAAGFTIASISKESGFILAVRGGNSLLTWQNPAINIFVSEAKGTSTIQIASTVGGQLIDYGTTADVVNDFCGALARIEMGAHCTIR
jgi:hypothetical protein